jgi:hypothetical protein
MDVQNITLLSNLKNDAIPEVRTNKFDGGFIESSFHIAGAWRKCDNIV